MGAASSVRTRSSRVVTALIRCANGSDRTGSSDARAPSSAPALSRIEASSILARARPSTIGDIIARDNATKSDYQQLANVVILVSLPIAGCTLAAGIAAGLADRKRPFSLLRLTGARLATLRRVVALEGAVPLLSVAAVAIGTGFGTAAMVATEVQKHPMVAPGGVLPPHRRRDHRVPRHHRGHLPAASPHHRTRSREKRMNLLPHTKTSPPNGFLLRAMASRLRRCWCPASIRKVPGRALVMSSRGPLCLVLASAAFIVVDSTARGCRAVRWAPHDTPLSPRPSRASGVLRPRGVAESVVTENPHALRASYRRFLRGHIAAIGLS